MEACFDGLRAFQSPDKDIVVLRGNKPVLHITATKKLTKSELIQTVREIRDMVSSERKARNESMNLYDAVCPVCGKVNRGVYLQETHGTMECDHCGNVVDVLGMENGSAIPILTKELCATIVAHAV